MTVTYRQRVFGEMEKRFGVDVADRVFSLEEDACAMSGSTKKSVLVENLRLLAQDATNLARSIDRAEMGTWRALVKEVRWWLLARGYLRIRYSKAFKVILGEVRCQKQ